MSTPFYVTTPIYYVNDIPHLGNAYTTIVADAFKRYHALRGEESRMLTGTDEHGLKVDREAKAHGLTPLEFTDKMSARFRAAWPELLINVDDFIRTTEPRHEKFVQDFWTTIEKNGFLYEGVYEGWYCVGCEEYKTEKDLEPGNICPLHKKPVERLKEPAYFFKLSAFGDKLLAYYKKHPDSVLPESRRNEVISFVQGGLIDLCVSRTSFSWGIPVPGNDKHIMFVWFDALTNYRSALGKEGDPLTRFWPPKGRVVHMVGKDILRFHAIYWPAFLMAAGYPDDALPTTVYAHGFLTVDGQKMSKALRNSVDPLRLARELTPDVLRYHLLRSVSFGLDGDFDHAALLERSYNADLGKNLGNLLQRTIGMCVKFTGGKIPAMHARTPLEDTLFSEVSNACIEIERAWDHFEPERALELTMQASSAANTYVDRSAPWVADKNGDKERVETILASLLGVLEMLSVMIAPAMPAKSAEMRAALALPVLVPTIGTDSWPVTFHPPVAGTTLPPPKPLFPTFDKDQTKAMLDKLMPKKEEPIPVTTPTGTAPAQTGAAPKPATASKEEPAGPSAQIDYDTFTKVDLRVGVVKTCVKVPKKDKLLQLEVDLGEEAPRQIVAGIALSFTPEQMIGRRVVVVANLAPREVVKGYVSHGMLLASGPSESLTLATIDEAAPAGARLK